MKFQGIAAINKLRHPDVLYFRERHCCVCMCSAVRCHVSVIRPAASVGQQSRTLSGPTDSCSDISWRQAADSMKLNFQRKSSATRKKNGGKAVALDGNISQLSVATIRACLVVKQYRRLSSFWSGTPVVREVLSAFLGPQLPSFTKSVGRALPSCGAHSRLLFGRSQVRISARPKPCLNIVCSSTSLVT